MNDRVPDPLPADSETADVDDGPDAGIVDTEELRTVGPMSYPAYLASQARIRAITGAARAHPPLPVTVPRPEGRDTAGPATSVVANVVRLPVPVDAPADMVGIRCLDGGRLTWRPITEQLGWEPGTRLAASWDRHWLRLAPAGDRHSRVGVDERGRILLEQGLRARLCVGAADPVVVRIRPGAGSVEIAHSAVAVRALDILDHLAPDAVSADDVAPQASPTVERSDRHG